MEIKKHPFQIWINEDEEFDVNSSIHKKYNYIYNPNDYTDADYIKTFSIIIKYRDNKTRIALVGDLHSSVEGCAIITGNQLLVLQNDTLSVIDMETGQLLRFVKIETFGCNFSIHSIETGYIIYGEIDILKLEETRELSLQRERIELYANEENDIVLNMLSRYDGISANYRVLKITSEEILVEKHLVDPGYTSALGLFYEEDYLNGQDTDTALYYFEAETEKGKYSSYKEAIETELKDYGFSWKLWDECSEDNVIENKYIIEKTNKAELVFEHEYESD